MVSNLPRTTHEGQVSRGRTLAHALRITEEWPAEIRLDGPHALLLHLQDADRLSYDWWSDNVHFRDNAVVPIIDLFDEERIVGAACWQTRTSPTAWVLNGGATHEFHFLDEYVPLKRVRGDFGAWTWAIAGNLDEGRLTIHVAASREQWARWMSRESEAAA